MRDRQRPRVEAADGSAQTPGDRGLFVCNKHLSLNPKTIGCMCMGVCVGEIGVGFTEKTSLKSRDPMKPQTRGPCTRRTERVRKEERMNGNEEGAGKMTRQMLLPLLLGGGRGGGGGGGGGVYVHTCIYVYICSYKEHTSG